ncbi:sigma-54 interaction domain-containing protein [Candidatus Nitrospira allomarina]|uniref:Sigma 54-interacting transcriptional regulator n=1 Tax=Candidatus Nitrospira allomarina TaxID=3020900 RepID=A0AA96JWW4_9BACT|nr:sigma 54-interacting transcriptional regulator [Candidatus Nitrospira allomarina]WNM58381.1 sigma 54-interacting transcriptional regulator [Candidatus Nitrospira allomarina]
MPGSIYDPALFSVFDALIFQKKTADRFDCVGDLPSWFPPPGMTQGSEVFPGQLLGHSFFLQHFLHEAQLWWDSAETGQWKSGLWSEPALFGEDVVLEATAVRHGSVRYVILQRFGPEILPIQPLLQKAREEQLSHRQAVNHHERTEAQLGTRLAKSEQERDDVMALLDGLGLGAIMVDSNREVTFVSGKARELLQIDPDTMIGRSLGKGLPWKTEDNARIEAMGRLPGSQRQVVSVVMDGRNRSTRALEVEVQDDPRDSRRTILLLTDVTEIEELRRQLVGPTQFHDLVGKCPAMRMIYERIRDIATVDVPVLIDGETGTGKELVARALHQLSPRHDHPFLPVNCAGLTDSLLGSQLFGHKRGAFTGATSDHAGFFESAEGGTLLLDEIGDMPLSIQTTLLRVLQEGEIIRLGESRPRKVNVRVLAATNQQLQELVDKGAFRADLLYRIRVARLRLPPLRERREDIPLLSTAFFVKSRVALGKMHVLSIAPETMQQFLRYSWPGNVRELKGALEYALIHCRGESVLPTDLPPELCDVSPIVQASPFCKPNERQLILDALTQTKGKRAQAAKLVGMSRSTFYRRLTELNISQEESSR